MKIKLTRDQWERIGQKAAWLEEKERQEAMKGHCSNGSKCTIGYLIHEGGGTSLVEGEEDSLRDPGADSFNFCPYCARKLK